MRLQSTPIQGDARSARAKQTSQSIASAPPLATEVMSLMTASPQDPAAVSAVLDRSPSMASRLLATINSQAYSTIETVRSVEHAVSLLGAREARRLTLSHAMLTIGETWGLDPKLTRKWWRCSMRKAVVASRCAQRAGERQAEEAFTLGLIQDIGMLGLIGCDGGFYERLPEGVNPWRMMELELDYFGMDHAAAGRSLLIRWGVHKPLWREVAYHHKMEETDSPAAAALRIAGCLPHLGGPSDEASLRRMQELYTQHFDHAETPLSAMLAKASADAAAMCGESPDPQLTRREIESRLQQALAEELISSSAEATQLRRSLFQTERELAIAHGEAMADPLTGALNRRGFFRAFIKKLQASGKPTPSVCCIVCDLDCFKSINDMYGHAAGDETLCHTAHLLTERLSNYVVGRTGGDEFCAVTVDVDPAEAKRQVHNLRAAFERIHLQTTSGHRITFSMSVGTSYAEAFDPNEPPDGLFNRADADMYATKENRPSRRSA